MLHKLNLVNVFCLFLACNIWRYTNLILSDLKTKTLFFVVMSLVTDLIVCLVTALYVVLRSVSWMCSDSSVCGIEECVVDV